VNLFTERRNAAAPACVSEVKKSNDVLPSGGITTNNLSGYAA
jgi:hypothetical protein